LNSLGLVLRQTDTFLGLPQLPALSAPTREPQLGNPSQRVFWISPGLLGCSVWNLPIGKVKNANQEIGVPGIKIPSHCQSRKRLSEPEALATVFR